MKRETDSSYRQEERERTKVWLESVGGSAAYHRQYRQGVRRRKKAGDALPGEGKYQQEPLSPFPPMDIPDTYQCQEQSQAQKGPESANSDAKMGHFDVMTEGYLVISLRCANSDAYLMEIPIKPGTRLHVANRDLIVQPP